MRYRAKELRDGDLWPMADVACRPAVLAEVAEAEQIALRYFPDRQDRQAATIIQAGGNCGVWPRMFANMGFTVHTFEPDDTNFACLVHNCAAHLGDRIIPYMAALTGEIGWGYLRVTADNVGAHYLESVHSGEPEGVRVRLLTLDSVVTPSERVVMIQLDVEGAEVAALQGAEAIIDRHHPLLWLEDKGLTRIVSGHSSSESWLRKEWPQYRVVERIRKDIILAWEGS